MLTSAERRTPRTIITIALRLLLILIFIIVSSFGTQAPSPRHSVRRSCALFFTSTRAVDVSLFVWNNNKSFDPLAFAAPFPFGVFPLSVRQNVWQQQSAIFLLPRSCLDPTSSNDQIDGVRPLKNVSLNHYIAYDVQPLRNFSQHFFATPN